MRRRARAAFAGGALALGLLATGCSGDGDAEPAGPTSPPTRTIDVFAIPEPELPDDYGEATPAALEAYVRYLVEDAYPYARRSGFPELLTGEFGDPEACRRCNRILDEVEKGFTDDTLVVMTDPVVDRVAVVARDPGRDGSASYTLAVRWRVEHEEVVAADGSVVVERDDLVYDDLILVVAAIQRFYVFDWIDAGEVTDGEA
jgi:hypothetical protein